MSSSGFLSFFTAQSAGETWNLVQGHLRCAFENLCEAKAVDFMHAPHRKQAPEGRLRGDGRRKTKNRISISFLIQGLVCGVQINLSCCKKKHPFFCIMTKRSLVRDSSSGSFKHSSDQSIFLIFGASYKWHSQKEERNEIKETVTSTTEFNPKKDKRNELIKGRTQ